MSQLSLDQLQQLVIHALEEIKAVKLNQLNVEGVSGFTDRMIFASGNSTRHVQSLSRSVIDAVNEAGGAVLGVEGLQVGDWVLIDLGDIVVHVMTPETRDFYDIERLWADQIGVDSHLA